MQFPQPGHSDGALVASRDPDYQTALDRRGARRTRAGESAMIHLFPPVRSARPEDAYELAYLINEAGEGLPYHLWSRMAEPGRDP